MKKHTKKESPPAGGTDGGTPPEAPPAAVPPPEMAAAPAAETAADELAVLKDRHLRLQADFDNFRKRTTRERHDAHRQAIEGLMQEMLPVLDHFEMGLKSASEQGLPEGLLDGFRLVWEQLNGVLRRFGLSPVDAQGQPFDPHRHESVALVPSERHARDAVVEQTRRGYALGPRLLRPAQVVLSSGPREPAPPEAPAAAAPADPPGGPAGAAPSGTEAGHA
jgi:molecular chaperone GrpE